MIKKKKSNKGKNKGREYDKNELNRKLERKKRKRRDNKTNRRWAIPTVATSWYRENGGKSTMLYLFQSMGVLNNQRIHQEPRRRKKERRWWRRRKWRWGWWWWWRRRFLDPSRQMKKIDFYPIDQWSCVSASYIRKFHHWKKWRSGGYSLRRNLRYCKKNRDATCKFLYLWRRKKSIPVFLLLLLL